MPRKPDSPAVAILKKEIAGWAEEQRRRTRQTPGWYTASAVRNALAGVLREVRAAERSPWMPSVPPLDGGEGMR